MPRLLVVEDDKLLNHTLNYNLQADGYETTAVFCITDARREVTDHSFDLIILDVNLPDGNGFDFCRELKQSVDTPVIFLTANDMESDMLKGYELGAEDYVTKPFPMSVFQKKISVLLKRTESVPEQDLYADDFLAINFSEFTTRLAGDPVILSPMEYRMLKVFTSNPKTVLTRQMLLDKLWDSEGNFVDENTLTSVISRVRGKIEKEGHRYIKTVYGIGYTWIGEKHERT